MTDNEEPRSVAKPDFVHRPFKGMTKAEEVEYHLSHEHEAARLIADGLIRLIADATAKHYSAHISRSSEVCSCGAEFSISSVSREWDEHIARITLDVISDRYELTPITRTAASLLIQLDHSSDSPSSPSGQEPTP